MSILDAGAIVALLRKEPGHEVVADALAAGAVMCVANLAEVATVLVRNGLSSDEVDAVLAELPIAVIEVNRDLAMQAGLLCSATKDFGLSLGDRLCLALAAREGRPVLTTDRSWTKVAPLIGIRVQIIR